MMRWTILGVVTAGLALGTGCVVDETGYGRDTDSAAGGDPPLSETDDGLPDADDGAGEGLFEDTVFYTSDGPLGADAAAVTVVGLPSATSASAVSAEVVGRSGPVDGIVGGGFVVVVQAALGDEVQLRYDGVDAGLLTLSDALGSVAAPSLDGAGDTGNTGDTSSVPAPEPRGGQVEVGAGDLPGLRPPYLAYNETVGASVRVDRGDTDATLPAEPGDRLCFVALGGTGRVSTATCFDL